MGIFSQMDKKIKMRWKLIIPLTIITAFGIIITVVITSYSLYWITLYQAKNKTFSNYSRSITASLTTLVK